MAEREVISEFEARRVERMLRSLFAGAWRPGETIRITGGVEGGWLAVRWELADPARSLVYPVEARVELKAERLREREAIDLLYDFLGAQFDEFLRAGRDPFSGPEWEEVEFAGRRLHVRGQLLGEQAEAAATAILDADALERSRRLREETAGHEEDPDDPDAADRDGLASE